MTTHIEKRKQTFKVLDENITVEADALIDDKTSKILFDLDLDNLAINLAFNKYRQKNDIMFPNEIVEMRKRHQLSQDSLAKLIGMSPNMIVRYEKGVLVSKRVNNLLQKVNNMH